MEVYYNDQSYDEEELAYMAYIDAFNKSDNMLAQQPVWCDSVSLLETYIKCHYKGLSRQTWKFDIDSFPYGVLVDLYPEKQIIIKSDINGNKYVLTKEQYVASTNSGAVSLMKFKLFDHSINTCMAMLKFIRSKDLKNAICKVNEWHRIHKSTDYSRPPEFDSFTLEAMTRNIQKYRIYPVGRRSNAILCPNDRKSFL